MKKFFISCVVILLLDVCVYECSTSSASDPRFQEDVGAGLSDKRMIRRPSRAKRIAEQPSTSQSDKTPEQIMMEGEYLACRKAFTDELYDEPSDDLTREISKYISWSILQRFTNPFTDKLANKDTSASKKKSASKNKPKLLTNPITDQPENKNKRIYTREKYVDIFCKLEKFFNSASLYCQSLCGINGKLSLKEFRNVVKMWEKRGYADASSIDFKSIRGVLVELMFGIKYMDHLCNLMGRGTDIPEFNVELDDFVTGEKSTVDEIQYDFQCKNRDITIIEMLCGIERSLLTINSIQKPRSPSDLVQTVAQYSEYDVSYCRTLEGVSDRACYAVFGKKDPSRSVFSQGLNEISLLYDPKKVTEGLREKYSGLMRYLECLLIYVQQLLGFGDACLNISQFFDLLGLLEGTPLAEKHVKNRCKLLSPAVDNIKETLYCLAELDNYMLRYGVSPDGTSKLLLSLPCPLNLDPSSNNYLLNLNKFKDTVSRNLASGNEGNEGDWKGIGPKNEIKGDNLEAEERLEPQNRESLSGDAKKRKYDEVQEPVYQGESKKCQPDSAMEIWDKMDLDPVPIIFPDEKLRHGYYQLGEFLTKYTRDCQASLGKTYGVDGIKRGSLENLLRFLESRLQLESAKILNRLSNPKLGGRKELVQKLAESLQENSELLIDMNIKFQCIRVFIERIAKFKKLHGEEALLQSGANNGYASLDVQNRDLIFSKDPEELNYILINAERHVLALFSNILSNTYLDDEWEYDSYYLQCIQEACRTSCKNFEASGLSLSRDAWESYTGDQLEETYTKLKEAIELNSFYCQRRLGLKWCTGLNGIGNALQHLRNKDFSNFNVSHGWYYAELLSIFSDIIEKLEYLKELNGLVRAKVLLRPLGLLYSDEEIDGIIKNTHSICSALSNILDKTFNKPDPDLDEETEEVKKTEKNPANVEDDEGCWSDLVLNSGLAESYPDLDEKAKKNPVIIEEDNEYWQYVAELSGMSMVDFQKWLSVCRDDELEALNNSYKNKHGASLMTDFVGDVLYDCQSILGKNYDLSLNGFLYLVQVLKNNEKLSVSMCNRLCTTIDRFFAQLPIIERANGGAPSLCNASGSIPEDIEEAERCFETVKEFASQFIADHPMEEEDDESSEENDQEQGTETQTEERLEMDDDGQVFESDCALPLA